MEEQALAANSQKKPKPAKEDLYALLSVYDPYTYYYIYQYISVRTAAPFQ